MIEIGPQERLGWTNQQILTNKLQKELTNSMYLTICPPSGYYEARPEKKSTRFFFVLCFITRWAQNHFAGNTLMLSIFFLYFAVVNIYFLGRFIKAFIGCKTHKHSYSPQWTTITLPDIVWDLIYKSCSRSIFLNKR